MARSPSRRFTAEVSLAVALATALLAGCSRPCDAPLTYRIGEIDSRFRLTKNDLLLALRRAEAIWEDRTQRNLFRYDEAAEMPVSLVYDARQLTAQENAERMDDIERASSSGEAIKKRLDFVSRQYEQAKKQFDSEKAKHDAAVDRHNATIRSWNARGGAPPSVLDEIDRETAALRAASDALENEREKINALADQANALADSFNRTAARVNENVAAVNTTAGQEFKQGVFRQQGRDRSIQIFEYKNMEDLVHVLAHEMGHALGLDHNENPASIMYGKSSSDTVRLTDDDVATLDRLCGG